MTGVTVVDAGPAEALQPGQVAAVEVDGLRIAVWNVSGTIYAMDDLCSHDEAYLSEGTFDIETATVRCPKHTSRFDLKTGRPLSFPAVRPVRTYPARIEQGRVLVEIDG